MGSQPNPVIRMIGTLGLDLAEPPVGLVAVEVGQADVDQGGRVGGLPRQGDRLVGVAGGLDGRPLAAEQVVGRPADRLVGVDDQEPRAGQPGRGGRRRPLRLGGDRRADLLDQAADLPGPVEQVPQPGDDVLVVAGVAVEDGGRVGEDVVQRQRQLAADRLDRGGRRADLLGLEQLQRVQRRGDVAGVDLQELAVAVVEGVGLRRSRR